MKSLEQLAFGLSSQDEVMKDFWDTTEELELMMKNVKHLDKLYREVMETKWAWGKEIFKMLLPNEGFLDEVYLAMRLLWGGTTEYDVVAPKFFLVNRLMHVLPNVLSTKVFANSESRYDLLKFVEISWEEKVLHKNFSLDCVASKKLHVLTTMKPDTVVDYIKEHERGSLQNITMRHLHDYSNLVVDGSMKIRWCYMTPENIWKFFNFIGVKNKSPEGFFEISPSEI